MPAKTREHYLQLAEEILSQSASFTKEREAAFRSALRLAEIASGGDGQRSKSEIPVEWRQWLATGAPGYKPDRTLERRDWSSSGGAYPGSAGGYFTPPGFEAQVWESMRAIDDLFDADTVTILDTPTGNPTAFPLSDDSQQAAAVVVQNAASSVQDTHVQSLQFLTTPTLRSGGITVTRELLQDSAVIIANYLADIFAKRYLRGLSPSIVAALVAASTVARTATGASAATQLSASGSDGKTSVSSDDLAATITGLDPAYSENASWLMNQGTLDNVLALRSSTGSLVFDDDRDEDGDHVIFGRKVKICPSLDSIGAGKTPILLGTLRRLCIRRVAGGSYLVRSDQLYATNLKVWFEGFARLDYGILWFADTPSTPNPFVALKNAS